MVSAPVHIVTDIGNTCHRLQTGGLHEREELLPHRREIHQMVRGAKILLRDLELDHHRGLLQGSEQRAVGLTGLEVDGTIFDLDNHIVGKLTIEGHELLTGLVGTIAALGVIHEGTPHHDSFVGLQCTSQHIGTIGMRTSEVHRTGLSLGIGFHEETAEVGNQFVDLVHLVLPPLDDLGIEGICRLQTTHLDGRCEVDGEIDADAIGAQLVGYRLGLLQTLRGEGLRLGIHIVEHRTVDTDGGTGTCIHLHTGWIGIEEDALSCKATLHGAVGIIPVVQDAQTVHGLLADVQRGC